MTMTNFRIPASPIWPKSSSKKSPKSNNIPLDVSECCDKFSEMNLLGAGQFGSEKYILGSWNNQKVVVKKIPKRSFGVVDICIAIRQFISMLQVTLLYSLARSSGSTVITM